MALSQKVLWIDDDPSILASAERLLRSHSWDFIGVDSVNRARELMLANEFAVVIADQRMQGGSGIDFLEFAKIQSPQTTRILLTGQLEPKVLEEAVNRGAVFRFIAKPWENTDLIADISAAHEHHSLQSEQSRLLKEVSRQNRRLEELTSGLEQLVAERTEHSEQSKDEVEAKLSRMRQLVRFIKDLSVTTSLDELLTILRKELKPFHSLRSFYLGHITSERQPLLLFFQGKQVVEKFARSPWPASSRMRLNELEDRMYLANEFGRPFVKVLAIPLRKRATAGFENEPPVTVFFEHAMTDQEVESFLNYISDYLQPVSLALDRILLEYSLKYTSLQWESTFDGIKDPIAIVDIDYKVVRANRHFTSKGFETRCHKLFAGSDEVCRGCPMAEALNTGQPKQGQIKRNGRMYDVLSYPIIIDGDQTATNVINHYVDVTVARQLHGQVVQNEKMAAIGLLAGNIAHELNNPLTGIRSLAQILISEIKDDNPLKSDLKEVESAAARSQKIIENLLEFSKGGGLEEREQRIPFNDVVERTLPMLKTAMRDHRSEINLTDEVTLVKAEPNLLQQVVFNLVNNACQAMEQAGTISIETEIVNNEGKSQVCLRVRDTGSGIPNEIKDAIFEPFFTTKEEGRGTGLGLSMSQSIIQNFGGEIKVTSEVGKGSTFMVYLPLVGQS